MRYLLIIAVTLFFMPAIANADLFYWVDDKGVLHITKNEKEVPPEYRGKSKSVKSTDESKKKKPKKKPAKKKAPALADDDKRKIYGEKPLSWWISEIRTIKNKISKHKSSIEEKKRYISVFEAGRYVDQIFEKSEVEAYNRYLKDIAKEEEMIKDLEGELSEVRRKARLLGVPKKYRE